MTKPELNDISKPELQDLIGLLLFTAIFKSNHGDINSIFATDGTGRQLFRAVMSKEHFSVLLTTLRFDNPDDKDLIKHENCCSY